MNSTPRRFSLSLRSAVLALVAIALLAAVVPAGLVVDRWLARELEARAWRDVAQAPAILEDRNHAIGDALMMHAKEVAQTPALLDALTGGDREQAIRVVLDAALALKHRPVLVGADGVVIDGPPPSRDLIDATRRGEMPVAVVPDSAGIHLISIAPIQATGQWIGAAGVSTALDTAAAEALAGLTRSDLVLLLAAGAAPVASAPIPAGSEIARAIELDPDSPNPRELSVRGTRYLVATGPLAGATVAFVRDLRRDMAMLPRLRQVLLASGAGALLVMLVLGSLLVLGLVRPVRTLAAAADRLSQGDFDAPLDQTRIREVARVSHAFDAMRASLAGRIAELRAANRMLEERQARLAALQAELIRRERVATSGRMAVELAHEIRNPVANLRNCLELLLRRLKGDVQGQEYASLAIDELLRMHELAERMLDLYRPRNAATGVSSVKEVAHEVATLAAVGTGDALSVLVRMQGDPVAAIPPDALKQVLLNLVQNAREAAPAGLIVHIDASSEEGSTSIVVCDNGPGVPVDLRGRIFDPFFTTRGTAGGMGLGLFVVEGIVRGHGGRVWLSEAEDSGACFHIVLPSAAFSRDLHANATVSREEVPS